jgi:hypothetical protein
LGLKRFYGNYSLFNIVPNLSFYNTKIVFRLQIQPELSLNAKISLKPKGRVGGYASFTVYDRTYSVRWNYEIPRKFVNTNIHRAHKIFSQDFTRLNGIKKVVGTHFCTSMVIDDFDVKGVSVMPLKADTPLFVDSDCILSIPCPPERVK